mgnify:CR=1 FL=1|tara:strand:+ start:120 stop:359 length:240 start_codon:yes stop_codon:yes gene_type:complete
MRAKTQIHVEYEVFKAILDSEFIGELLNDVNDELVPPNDVIALNRFQEGVKSAALLINNLMERRLHRLPNEHPDYVEKV